MLMAFSRMLGGQPRPQGSGIIEITRARKEAGIVISNQLRPAPARSHCRLALAVPDSPIEVNGLTSGIAPRSRRKVFDEKHLQVTSGRAQRLKPAPKNRRKPLSANDRRG